MTGSIDETGARVDTNVVIYAYEIRDLEKAARAEGPPRTTLGIGPPRL